MDEWVDLSVAMVTVLFMEFLVVFGHMAVELSQSPWGFGSCVIVWHYLIRNEGETLNSL